MAIAYQVVGDGPVDLVFTPFFGNCRYAWEQPLCVRFFERLASFSRLILFDKRGTGLSDRPRVLTLETQMDDIRAVLDAVGSERAMLLGAVQGSQLCALFAATYPERTRALVLYHPDAAPTSLLVPPRSADEARERWGTPELADEIAQVIYPSLAQDEAFLRWHADYLRFSASPGAAAEFFRMLTTHRHLRRPADHPGADARALPGTEARERSASRGADPRARRPSSLPATTSLRGSTTRWQGR